MGGEIFFDKKNHKKKKDLAVFGLWKNSSQKYYFTKNSGYDSSFKELYFESKIIKKYFWKSFFNGQTPRIFEIESLLALSIAFLTENLVYGHRVVFPLFSAI